MRPLAERDGERPWPCAAATAGATKVAADAGAAATDPPPPALPPIAGRNGAGASVCAELDRKSGVGTPPAEARGSPGSVATTAAVTPAGATGAIGGSSAPELALGSSSARGGATRRGLSGVGDDEEGTVAALAPAAAEEPDGALASAGAIAAVGTEGTRATLVGAAVAWTAPSAGADVATG